MSEKKKKESKKKGEKKKKKKKKKITQNLVRCCLVVSVFWLRSRGRKAKILCRTTKNRKFKTKKTTKRRKKPGSNGSVALGFTMFPAVRSVNFLVKELKRLIANNKFKNKGRQKIPSYPEALFTNQTLNSLTTP